MFIVDWSIKYLVSKMACNNGVKMAEKIVKPKPVSDVNLRNIE